MEPRAFLDGTVPGLGLFDLSGQQDIPDHKTCTGGDKKRSQRCASGKRIPRCDDTGKHPKFDEYNRRLLHESSFSEHEVASE